MMTTAIEQILEPWIDRVTGSGQIIIERCPYCDMNGHLYVSIRTGLWICFRCNKKGNVTRLYSELEGMTYAEAEVEIKSAGIRRAPSKPIRIDDGDPIEIDPPSEFAPCYKGGRFRIPVYLKIRRITRRAIKEWGIGFCEKGRYRNRIVFPIATAGERTFVTRATLPGMFPPYLGPEVDEGKGRRFLPGWKFVNRGDQVVLCEGLFDALRIWQAGFKPLALLGKGLGLVQRKRIVDLSLSRLVILLDSDAWKAARGIADELSPFVKDLRIVALEDGDPGDHEEHEIRELVNRAESVEAAERSRMLAKLSELSY